MTIVHASGIGMHLASDPVISGFRAPQAAPQIAQQREGLLEKAPQMPAGVTGVPGSFGAQAGMALRPRRGHRVMSSFAQLLDRS